jgi:Tol biopolymer transport system component
LNIAPSWSPDGERIAFASQRHCNWDIYVMDADGKNPVNLTNNIADGGNSAGWYFFLVGDTAWSPLLVDAAASR